MKKKNRQKIEDFDKAFDEAKVEVNFKDGILTDGLSKVIKLHPMTIPVWLDLELECISKLQANSKSSVIRQLLVEAIQNKKKAA